MVDRENNESTRLRLRPGRRYPDPVSEASRVGLPLGVRPTDCSNRKLRARTSPLGHEHAEVLYVLPVVHR